MSSNSSINILGGMPDWELIIHFMREVENQDENEAKEPHYTYTSIKTTEAVSRFKRAILDTFLKFRSSEIRNLVQKSLYKDGLSSDNLILLFWHGSSNNFLLEYLNENVFFPAYYSGRISMKGKEPMACLKDSGIEEIKNWSNYTLEKVSTKYLTLLKKFGLMEGRMTKQLIHPFLSDRMFVVFILWLTQIETKSNLLNSKWIKYSFMEQQFFIERLLQKKFVRFFNVIYTGEKLSIEPQIEINTIFNDPIFA